MDWPSSTCSSVWVEPWLQVGDGVTTNQGALQDHQLQAFDRLGAPIGHTLDVDRHLRRGVKGLEHELRAQQFHTLDGLDQFTVFERQTLNSLQTQVEGPLACLTEPSSGM